MRPSSDPPTVPVSAIVPTLDEERNIAECLESLAPWLDDVVVFDSHSTDRTVEIATAMGARVVRRRFDNFSAHKNWALDNIDLRHEWVLFVDADERMTPATRHRDPFQGGSGAVGLRRLFPAAPNVVSGQADAIDVPGLQFASDPPWKRSIRRQDRPRARRRGRGVRLSEASLAPS